MKRKFIIAGVMAMLMLSGCGGENSGDAGVTEAADTSYSESSAEVRTQSEADVTEAENVTEEVTEEDMTEEEAVTDDTSAESGDEAVTEEKLSDGVFRGSGYTLEIDGSKWTDIAEFMEGSVNLNTAEGFDGMFVRADKSGANMTFISLNVQLPADITAEDYLKEIEQQYSEAESLELISCEDSTVGGNKCIKALTENTAAGAKLMALQYMFPRDSAAVVMTFTAGEDEWEELLPEFEEVVNSIEFE